MQDIITVPELIEAISDVSGLQNEIRIYDISGNEYRIVNVYVQEEDENTVFIDVEKDNYVNS